MHITCMYHAMCSVWSTHENIWWDLSTVLQHITLPSQNHSLKYHIIQIVEVCKFHNCVVLPASQKFHGSMDTHHVWFSYDMAKGKGIMY